MIDYEVLLEDLESNEDVANLVEVGNDQAVAVWYNQVREDVTITLPSMPRGDVLLALIPAITLLPTKSEAVQKAWDRILGVLQTSDSVQVTSPQVQALMAAGVADGLLTTQQASTINARSGSRAEQLFGPGTVLQHTDVARAFGRF